MKIFTKTNLKWTVLLGIFALAPVAATTNAEAKPPSHAPAWGYRNKDSSDWKWDKRDDRRDWRRDKRRERRSDWRNDWRRDSKRGRYVTKYRTRRDRNGRTYRDYYRVWVR